MATLKDLRQKKEADILTTNQEEFKVLSKDEFRQLIPKKQEENKAVQFLNDELSAIDDIINSQKAQIQAKQEEVISQHEEELEDALFDAPVEDIDAGLLSPEEADKALKDAFTNAISTVKEDEVIKTVSTAIDNAASVEYDDDNLDDLLNELDDDQLFNDDEDLDDEDDVDIVESEDENEELDDEDRRQMLEDVKSQIDSSIKAVNNVIDIKAFTVSKKPKRAAKVLEQAHTKQIANWVLLSSGVPFTCSALSAIEIDNLDPNKLNRQNGRITALKQMYGTLFSHYESPNKPATLEEWLQTISFTDQDNLFFGYYKATFGLSNLVTYACEKCNNVKIKNVDINECIKYKNDSVKETVSKILAGDPTYRDLYKVRRIQVSDDLVIDIKNPSIYNVVFELGILDEEFSGKFASVLGVVSYIDTIYQIDREACELIPINVKEDAKNLSKSVKRRIRAKVQLLRNLTSDQYNILTAEIAKLAKDSESIEYCLPEYTCEKCGTKINEAVIPAQQLLFMRHQLVLVKTLSVE